MGTQMVQSMPVRQGPFVYMLASWRQSLVWTQSQYKGGTGAGQGDCGGREGQVTRAGDSGEATQGDMWHPIWTLKNEKVVARPGQWRRHLAEGTAGAEAERREIAWRA